MKTSTKILASLPLVAALSAPLTLSMVWAETSENKVNSTCDKSHKHMGKRFEHRKDMKFLKKALRGIDLSQEQKNNIHTVLTEQRFTHRPLQQSIKKSQLNLLSLDAQSSSYDTDLAQLASEHGALLSQKFEAQAETWRLVSEQLTTEQIQKLAEKKQAFLERAQ